MKWTSYKQREEKHEKAKKKSKKVQKPFSTEEPKKAPLGATKSTKAVNDQCIIFFALA